MTKDTITINNKLFLWLKVINHLNVKARVKWELGYVQSQLPDCTQSTTSRPSNQNRMIQMQMIVCNHTIHTA